MSTMEEPQKIAVDKLSADQLQRLVMMHEQAMRLLIACNNELGLRFEKAEGRTPQQSEIFALWSSAVNEILEAADKDLDAIIFGGAGRNGTVN